MKQKQSYDEQVLPPDAVQTFLHCLASAPGRRLESGRLWECFRQAFPYRPGGAENRKWLWIVLEEAADQGIIRFPSQRGNCWDRTLEPLLPTVVWKNKAQETRRVESWREYPWLPQLAWVAHLPTLSEEHEAFLKHVLQALREGQLRQQAPLTYRSLQLTGNEKRLGELLHTALFRPGRLSLELLGCVPDIPPLALEEIGEASAVLVFENAAAFRTASRVLKQYAHPPYGLLGFGAGAAFERSIRHIQFLKRRVERIEYVGDLDRPGLRVARNAARLANAENLPPIQPARGLHRAMLQSIQQFGYPNGLEYDARERRKVPGDEELVGWLPEDVRAECLMMVRAGNRIPEEVLGPDELQRVWQECLDSSE
jgi:hypothetical protein